MKIGARGIFLRVLLYGALILSGDYARNSSNALLMFGDYYDVLRNSHVDRHGICELFFLSVTLSTHQKPNSNLVCLALFAYDICCRC